jgi:hypothetical protein
MLESLHVSYYISWRKIKNWNSEKKLATVFYSLIVGIGSADCVINEEL